MQRWTLAHPDKAAIAQECLRLAGLAGFDGTYERDLSEKRYVYDKYKHMNNAYVPTTDWQQRWQSYVYIQVYLSFLY